MNRLLSRVHAPASTQPLLPPSSSESMPAVVTTMLEKMCPDAVPLWKECNKRDLVLLLWEDKLAACFSCEHCKEQVAAFRSELIGDTSIVYLHTDKNLPLHIARTYLAMLCVLSKVQCYFKHGVPALEMEKDVTCWGFPHGNHALPTKVRESLAQYDAVCLDPPLVLSETRFCCDHPDGVLLVSVDANGVVKDITAASYHYTNIVEVDADTKLESSNSLFVEVNDAPQHGAPTLKQFIDDVLVHHVFASNLPVMQTGVQQVAIFPDSHVFTIVCADDPDAQRLFVLGSLDDKHRLRPQLILGITPPDAPCIHRIIQAVLTADADLYARAFDAHSVINNCNYDSITPGTSIHSGHAHDSIIEKGATFFRNTFANYLHWSSGGRFICSVCLDKTHTLIIMGALQVLYPFFQSECMRCAVAGVVHQGSSYCARAQALVLEHNRQAVTAIHSWPIHTQKGVVCVFKK